MYRALLERRAERDLKRLPPDVFDRVIEVIKGLEADPRPPGVRKIVGSERDWRLRVGTYRVIYEIDDASRQVRVMRVRHRREAYK